MKRFSIAVAFFALVACGEPSAPAGQDSAAAALAVIDAYQLKTRNGSAVPILIATNHTICDSSGCTPTGMNSYVTDGVISLNTGNTWTRVITSKLAASPSATGTVTTTTTTGTYATSANGTTITFALPDGTGTFQGALSGNTLTFVFSETWVYQR